MTTVPTEDSTGTVTYGPQKAIVGAVLAALTAGLSTLYTALDDGIVTTQEGVGIAGAVVAALIAVGGGVYAVSNKVKGH